MGENPLLQLYPIINFPDITAEHVVPAIEHVLRRGRKKLEQICQTESHDYNSLVEALDIIEADIEEVWSPITVLHGTADFPELREKYNEARRLLVEFNTELKSNPVLYQKFNKFYQDNEIVDVEMKSVVEHRLRDFKLSGAGLAQEEKIQYRELVMQLSNLQNKFAENVLDATRSYELWLEEEQLSGLPTDILGQMAEEAKSRGKDGYCCTLQMPIVKAILSYADDEKLRQEVYMANATRATSGENNNSELLEEILRLRQKLAKILGFETYAHYSLATKNAASPQKVLDFLYRLEQKTRAKGCSEYREVYALKQKSLPGELRPWDYPYYCEKLRRQQFDLCEEDLRPYFPIDSVLKGLFSITEKIYGFQVEEMQNHPRWHKEVRYFRVVEQGQVLGEFFFDFFPRANKRGGAWMQDIRGRITRDNSITTPIGLIAGNVNRPSSGMPALLTHREVATLFHEFGHLLQLLLTKCCRYSVSGLNGVPWDVIELPSQFMENWIWQKESLRLFAHHYRTAEEIPEELCDKLLAARNFQKAILMRRQLEFGLVDMHLHYDSTESPIKLAEKIHEIMSPIALEPGTNHLASFLHLFAGGYAAGYYSYKWAEVWEADAFEFFMQSGIFDLKTGLSFRHNILERGGSEDPLILFQRFRGKEPCEIVLLNRAGILDET